MAARFFSSFPTMFSNLSDQKSSANAFNLDHRKPFFILLELLRDIDVTDACMKFEHICENDKSYCLSKNRKDRRQDIANTVVGGAWQLHSIFCTFNTSPLKNLGSSKLKEFADNNIIF